MVMVVAGIATLWNVAVDEPFWAVVTAVIAAISVYQYRKKSKSS